MRILNQGLRGGGPAEGWKNNCNLTDFDGRSGHWCAQQHWLTMLGLDRPEFGPGPHGPGSGPDRPHRSECSGQWEVGLDPILKVQVQVVSEPDLGVGPGLDPNRTSIYSSMYYTFTNIILYIIIFTTTVFKKWRSLKSFISTSGKLHPSSWSGQSGARSVRTARICQKSKSVRNSSELENMVRISNQFHIYLFSQKFQNARTASFSKFQWCLKLI